MQRSKTIESATAVTRARVARPSLSCGVARLAAFARLHQISTNARLRTTRNNCATLQIPRPPRLPAIHRTCYLPALSIPREHEAKKANTIVRHNNLATQHLCSATPETHPCSGICYHQAPSNHLESMQNICSQQVSREAALC